MTHSSSSFFKVVFNFTIIWGRIHSLALLKYSRQTKMAGGVRVGLCRDYEAYQKTDKRISSV